MSYTGLVATIPLGEEGLTGNKNENIQRPSQLVLARNITWENNITQKEGGWDYYNASPISGAPLLDAGWDWWPTATAQRMIVSGQDGSVYRDAGTGTFPVTMASGLSASPTVPVFVECGAEVAGNNRTLLYFTGVNAVTQVDGDAVTLTAITAAAADWTGSNQPYFGVVHAGRVWAGGNSNDPHRLYYSTTTDHTDFAGAGSGSVSVFPGESERLMGGVSFKGLLIVFKYPTGIYLVDTRDPTAANWTIERLTNAVGLPGPRAITIIGNQDAILWLDQGANIRSAVSVQDFGNIQTSNLSQSLSLTTYLREIINFARLPYAQALYYPEKDKAYICLSSTGLGRNDLRLSIDFTGGLPRFQISEDDASESLWLRKDGDNIPRPTIGAVGQVKLFDMASRNRAGAAYTAEAQTPSLDLGFIDTAIAHRRKNGQFLELVMKPASALDSTVYVDVFWDDQFSETILFGAGAIGTPLGQFQLDVSALGYSVAATRRKQRLRGSGQRIAFRVYNPTKDSDVQVSAIRLFFTVGAERA